MTEIETNAVETREVQTEFWIPARNLTKLTQKLDRLVRRANKLGVEPIRYEVTSSTEERDISVAYASAIQAAYGSDDADGLSLRSPVSFPPVFETYTLVKIEGVAPKFAGWSLVARVGYELKTPIFLTVPGKAVSDKYRACGPVCEHCKSLRHRKDTFIVEHEDGRSAQVGSNCIADFLGHQSPEQIAFQCELLPFVDGLGEFGEDVGEDLRAGLRQHSTFGLEYFLVLVATYTRVNGWLTSSAAEKIPNAIPSAQIVFGIANGWSKQDEIDRKVLAAAHIDADSDLAKSAIEWAKNLEAGSEYQQTIRTVAAAGKYSHRLTGIAASIVGAYKRHLEGEVIRKARAEKATANPSTHQGVVGEKLTRKLLLVSTRSFDSAFGVTNLNRFSDEDGNAYIWWTSTELDVEVGGWCNLTGTVKTHDAYRDVPQTVLTRCKLVPTADESAEIASLSAEAVAVIVCRDKYSTLVRKVEGGLFSDEDCENPPFSELLAKGWVRVNEATVGPNLTVNYVWDRPAHILEAVKAPKAKRAKKTA